jgi:hypothetical protein
MYCNKQYKYEAVRGIPFHMKSQEDLNPVAQGWFILIRTTQQGIYILTAQYGRVKPRYLPQHIHCLLHASQGIEQPLGALRRNLRDTDCAAVLAHCIAGKLQLGANLLRPRWTPLLHLNKACNTVLWYLVP